MASKIQPNFQNSAELLLSTTSSLEVESDVSNNTTTVLDVGLAVTKGIVLSIFTLLVIFGNLLVVCALATNRRLRRNVTYRFILSLAVADLLLGVIVLPINAVTIAVFDNRWMLGPIVCNLITSFDVMLCTASILNLFLTTCERYVAIVKPLHYNRYITRKNVFVAIALVWIVSAFCSFVPLHLGWNTADGQVQNQRKNDSLCTFEYNITYNTTISVATFFIPLVLLACANVRILKIAQSQNRFITRQKLAAHNNFNHSDGYRRNPYHSRRKNSREPFATRRSLPTETIPLQNSHNSHNSQNSQNSQNLQPSQQSKLSVNESHLHDSLLQMETVREDSVLSHLNSYHHSRASMNSGSAVSYEDGENTANTSRRSSKAMLNDFFRNQLKRVSLSSSTLKLSASQQTGGVGLAIRNHKATITILTIVGFFVACWLPYFILFTVKPFLDRDAWEAFTQEYPNFEPALVWLGYINSLCNPIIYTCLNRQFRLTFAKLLRLGKRNRSEATSAMSHDSSKGV